MASCDRPRTRREFLRLLASGAAAGMALPLMSGDADAAEPHPNVVVVIADDHRWDLMSCMGNKFLQTPNFDRLAKEGCVFENAFAVCGVCSPSRAAFLTGRYSHQCGAPAILRKNNSFLECQRPFPALLHNAGYHSAHFGKWHLGDGHLPKLGYDHWAGFDWMGEFFNTRVWVNGKMKQFEGYSDDILSKLAADHIRERVRSGKPFCAWVALKAPHLPFAYPSRHEHLLDDAEIPKPDSFSEDYGKSGRAPCLRETTIRIETFKGGLPGFDNSWDKYVKSYYRAVNALDDALGEVMKAIDEAGIADNTILVYTSDQGYTLGEHGMTEKHFAYEQVMRIPMLVRYPKLIKPGSRRKELALNIDLAPTLLDLCSVRVPGDMSGRSWCPLLKRDAEPAENWREDFLFEYWDDRPELPAQLAVRTTRCKFISYEYGPYEELYDLEKDPHENRNVAPDPAYAVVLADMSRRLERLKKETGWSLRGDQGVRSCYVLGPVPESMAENLGKSISSWRFDGKQQFDVDGKMAGWTKVPVGMDGRLHFAEESSDGVVFLAIPVERRSKWDPCALLQLDPGKSAKAYFAGKVIWEHGQNTPQCNPPLPAKDGFILLQAPSDIPDGLSIVVNAPADSLKLP